MGKSPSEEQPERAALLPIRKEFELFANLRPGNLYPELSDLSPLRSETVSNGIDVLCVRELTGGIYFGQPKSTQSEDGEETALDTMIYKTSEIEKESQKLPFEQLLYETEEFAQLIRQMCWRPPFYGEKWLRNA